MLVRPQPLRVLMLVHLLLSFPSHRVALERLLNAHRRIYRGSYRPVCHYARPRPRNQPRLPAPLCPARLASQVPGQASSRPSSAQSSPWNVERCRPRQPSEVAIAQPGAGRRRDTDRRTRVPRGGERRGNRRRCAPGRGLRAHQPYQGCQCSATSTVSDGSTAT